MKMRLFTVILTVIFIIISVCGCGDSVPDNVDDSNVISDTSSEPSNNTDTSDNSDYSDNSDISDPNEDNSNPEPPEEKDFFTENGQGELPAPEAIPDFYTSTETPHLYSLPLDLPNSDGYSVYTADDVLYLLYLENDTDIIRSYSLTTGEIITEYSCAYWGSKGVLDNGGMWLVDNATLKVEFLDKNGAVTVIKEGQIFEADVFPQDTLITPDGKYMLVSYGTMKDVELYNLTTGECLAPESLKNFEIWYMSMVGEEIMCTLPNEQVVFFDPETEIAEKYIPSNSMGNFYGGLYINVSDNALTLNSLSDEEKRLYMSLDYCESVSACGYGYLVTENYFDVRTYSFYNLRANTLVSSVELSPESIGAYIGILNNGRALILDYLSNGAAVYIYDLPFATTESNATPAEIILCTEAELKENTKAVADKVLAEYGVELLYASNGNDFVLYDYVGTAELDSFKVYKSVCETADILSLYPENMLKEIYEDTHKGLRFYLCGTLYGISDGTLTNAGAITTDNGGYIIIAFDINDPLEYNIPHELSHAFDRRIMHMFENGSEDWMQIWESATPVDGYLYSYEDYENYYSYTSAGESDESRIWFVDNYARTFPTEDRARIMEYLFNPEEGELAAILQNDNLIYKAKLYCYILRQCFPSCNIDEALYWEAYLGEIDSSVIE